MPSSTLREHALAVLLERDPDRKAAAALALDTSMWAGVDDEFEEPAGIPGRPDKPELVPPSRLKARSPNTLTGRAALIHALAHIELNAVDLALDLVWRFAGMPDLFYRQWVGVAQEEARHFQLLRDHLRTLGHDYGDFPAHDALWDMAQRTRHDLLARIALVPRTLEARGLDAAPPLREKLLKAGDHDAAAILETILRDEIGHVAIGNQWYRSLCTQRGLDPLRTYAELAACHGAPRLRGPFNLEARRAAGFLDDELDGLGGEPGGRRP